MLDPRQRDIWWADLGQAQGSEAAFHRPVVILQSDAINLGRLQTYLCAPMTANLATRVVPWNLLVPKTESGLDRDSVVQTHLLLALNRSQLNENVGRITDRQLEQLFRCLDIALGR